MKRSEKGFTLIELLVVVAIIGILAAIAIPQFAAYKVRAHNAQAKSDLRNGITAEEAYYVDEDEYVSCGDPTTCETTLPGFKASKLGDGAVAMGTFSYTAGNTADGQVNGMFTANAEHLKGNVEWNYDSESGRICDPANDPACP